ncbi:MAG: hypothetical protein KatS3mg059_0984 [Thermomicrobiales bacterium]|nr:MAG: hypothetical protein KatS3mg059_0984 [Thermomicrobiales bacterium]
MSTIGELSDIGVSDLIELFSRRERTGRLTVKTGGDEVRLVFDRGQLVRITSSDLSLRLGRMLIRQGLLSSAQLLEALHTQAEAADGRPLGTILLARGWVTETDLRRCIEEQSIEVIARIIDDQPGIFIWDPGLEAATQAEALPLDPGSLVSAARERTAALQMLRKQLPDPGTPLFLAAVTPVGTFPAPERMVISALRGGAKTLTELHAQLALDELSLGVAVLGLRQQGIIASVDGQRFPVLHAHPAR